jgi:glycerophosphoryl diester phosphodiesterase
MVSAHSKVVAHRGASHDAPENTLAAFDLAWQQGADAVECDVWMTHDARLVCHHDRTTRRTAGAQLDVTKSTLAQLRQLDVGRWKGRKWKGERIPTLDEVLAGVPAGGTVFVEIKGGPLMVPVLNRAVERAKLPQSHVVAISFDKEVIRSAKQTIPGIKAFLLVKFHYRLDEKSWRPSTASLIEDLKDTGADGLDVSAVEAVTEGFVRNLHDAGWEVHVWTVNGISLATRCWALDVDSITTDRPKVIKDLAIRLEKGKAASNQGIQRTR